MKQLVEATKKRLFPEAWVKASLLKKIYYVLEFYCSREVGLWWKCKQDNRHTDFVTYKLGLTFKLASKIEFFLRKKLYRK